MVAAERTKTAALSALGMAARYVLQLYPIRSDCTSGFGLSSGPYPSTASWARRARRGLKRASLGIPTLGSGFRSLAIAHKWESGKASCFAITNRDMLITRTIGKHTCSWRPPRSNTWGRHSNRASGWCFRRREPRLVL